MKYHLGMQTVEAIYDNTGSRNPLIEALPECQIGRASCRERE